MGRVFPGSGTPSRYPLTAGPASASSTPTGACSARPVPRFTPAQPRPGGREDTHVSFDPKHTHDARYDDPIFREPFGTLVTHYWANGAFLGPDRARRMPRIAHISGVLIHGRLDVSSPLNTARRVRPRRR